VRNALLLLHSTCASWSPALRFESCRASDREFAQLQENFERIVHLSARQLKHKRRWRSLVHWAIGMVHWAIGGDWHSTSYFRFISME
jgi:hypothetical protein